MTYMTLGSLYNRYPVVLKALYFCISEFRRLVSLYFVVVNVLLITCRCQVRDKAQVGSHARQRVGHVGLHAHEQVLVISIDPVPLVQVVPEGCPPRYPHVLGHGEWDPEHITVL